ncbi:putative cell wall-binding protein/N-acetyl-anhydromuramyl-L-alanine amidase AmpD [Metabacillus crassostreae]|uniref:cell wall-binding repeat-containing protein n=1 Tax=Metabacillus crassostreae TaxID=929098 RepID=UPI0019587667|nr:putative cell wall-binding protein/N-acetyl-anhydromuramyl-L-alanine amidase AmpD [Metabacillus crassostreae]
MIKVIGLILLTLLFNLSFQVNTSIAATTERIKGTDRYKTAVEISKKGWNTAETVILAKGTDFPDALAGGPLAYSKNAPILLTNDKVLTDVTRQEVLRLKASKAILLGSEGAISIDVENSLRSLGLEMERIGGQHRFETAANIAKKLSSNKAFITNGRNFPDALAIAPYAARNEIPILLTEKETLPEATYEIVKTKTQTFIIGKEGVIDKNVEQHLVNPTRYGGKDRYHTNQIISGKFAMDSGKAFVATGEDFADALSGSVLAAKSNSTILLVQKSKLPATIQTIQKNYKHFSIYGGFGAVSNEVQTSLAGIQTIQTPLPLKNSKVRDKPITHIVTHFMSNAASKPEDPYNIKDLQQIFLDYNVSAHYLIGRNGEMHQLVPENRAAFHAGKGTLINLPYYKDQLNSYSIGIEMMAIGTKEEMKSMMSSTQYNKIHRSHIGYTEAQYKSLKLLVDDIVARNPFITRDRKHIIGHDEYSPERKSDPGSLFNWAKIGL